MLRDLAGRADINSDGMGKRGMAKALAEQAGVEIPGKFRMKKALDGLISQLPGPDGGVPPATGGQTPVPPGGTTATGGPAGAGQVQLTNPLGPQQPSGGIDPSLFMIPGANAAKPGQTIAQGGPAAAGNVGLTPPPTNIAAGGPAPAPTAQIGQVGQATPQQPTGGVVGPKKPAGQQGLIGNLGIKPMKPMAGVKKLF